MQNAQKHSKQPWCSSSSSSSKQSKRKKKMQAKWISNKKRCKRRRLKKEHLRRSNQTLSIHKLADMRHSSYTSRHSTQIITWSDSFIRGSQLSRATSFALSRHQIRRRALLASTVSIGTNAFFTSYAVYSITQTANINENEPNYSYLLLS